MNTTPARLDHLVVAAPSLAEGVAWCEATLGVTPGPGGEHPLMGTHNRLLALEMPGSQRAYLEIIAINPAATPTRTLPLQRWFDLDAPALQRRVAEHGPTLIHWVARVPDVVAGCKALASLGVDRGNVLQASRATPAGLLEWQISVRDDGQRLMHGGLPTLIQWGAVHPAPAMADSGLVLQSLQMTVPDAPLLEAALQAVGALALATSVTAGPPALTVTLNTPRGTVVLGSGGV